MTIEDIKSNNCILLECISGSRAYNLHTESSDTDIKGVFYLPKSKFFGLEYIPQISNETNDIVYYELGRFVDLLIKNNPNMLELLASPAECVLHRHPIMDHLSSDLFLSKLCRETFANYAISQIKKARGLKKKINNPMDEKRKTLLDFCFMIVDNGSTPIQKWLLVNNKLQANCGLAKIPNTKGMYALYYNDDNAAYQGIITDENSNDVSLSSIPKGVTPVAYLFCNLDSYSIYCKEYREYWSWIEKRNEARYISNINHGKNYDGKNMMHTIRLLQMAKEIIEDQEINVWRTDRDMLLSIKSGSMEFDDLMDMGAGLMKDIDEIFEFCHLPDVPDAIAIEKILIEIRSELYK